MYIQVTETMFIEEFRNMDRMDNFSIDGLKALYEFLEELEGDTQDIEMDVISICCDFTELSWDDVKSEYSNMIDQDELAECEDEEEVISVLQDFLSDQTMIVYHDDEKVLFQVF